MRRMISLLVITILFLAVAGAPVACAKERSPQVIWQLKNVGKLTSELQLGPNGLFYAQAGNKLTVADENGRKLWDTTVAGASKVGRPVFDSRGSVFIPGNSLVQEIKLNGGKGWSFTVASQGSKAAAQLTTGPGDLLYLILPTALYALDTAGHYQWMVMQWGLESAGSAKIGESFNISACAGNEHAIFVIIGRKNGGSSLLALSEEGKIYWRYSLGEVKDAQLVTGKDGRLYATVNPNKTGRAKYGTVYAFDSNNGKLLWSYKTNYNNLTAPTVSAQGLLYFCAEEGLFALNEADGKEAWSQKFLKVISPPAVDESSGRVYLGTKDKRLLAVTPAGRLDWDLDLGANVSKPPLVGPDGFIYVVTDAGVLYKIKDEPL